MSDGDGGDDAGPAGEPAGDPPGDLAILAIAGSLAAGVARELAAPLRKLRETLSDAVESLDAHAAGSKGPTPLPWKQVSVLRERVAEAYLISRSVARLSGDLAVAIPAAAAGAEERVTVDVNKLVEAAVNMARHRLPAEADVFIDLGAVPMVRARPGRLMLAVAQLVAVAARSVRGVAGGAVSIKTVGARNPEGDWVVVSVADNGAGDPEAAAPGVAIVRRIVEEVGGGVEAACERDAGSTYELWLPAAPDRGAQEPAP